jgi:competence protein ComEA
MWHRLVNWLSLTRAEQRVILFLSATLLIGAGIRFYQEAFPPTRQFDYRSADSSFAAFREQLASDTVQKKAGTPGQLLNINSASKDELVGLPGIGQTLAQRIVLFRENEGEFASIDDLQKVKGISKKKLEKLKPYITVY